MDSVISPIYVSAVVFAPFSSEIFVADIPSVVFFAVVFPSTSFGTLNVFADVPSTAILLNLMQLLYHLKYHSPRKLQRLKLQYQMRYL